jgi:hypothetical protein
MSEEPSASEKGWHSPIVVTGCEDRSSQSTLIYLDAPMDLELTICPKCGGTATLLQTREDFEEIPERKSTASP